MIALAVSTWASLAVAQNTRTDTSGRAGMLPEAIAIYDGLLNQRQPLTTLDGLLNVPALRAALDDDARLIAGFNLIVRSDGELLSDEDLAALEDDFAFEALKAKALREAGGDTRRVQAEFLRNLRFGVHNLSVFVSPNIGVTRQIDALFERHLGVSVAPAIDDAVRRSSCDALKRAGFACRGYDPYVPMPRRSDDRRRADVADATGPSIVAYARMSRAVYLTGKTGRVPASIEGYDFVGSRASGSADFGAYVFRKGTDVVIAFRGTEENLNRYVEWIDHLADASWLFGSTRVFGDKVERAIDVLVGTSVQFPDARLYLTGHSLGGAIALMLGAATNLPTVAFDAPGPGDRFTEMRAAFATLGSLRLRNRGASVNYRLLGDPISLFGVPLGTTCTVYRPRPNPPSLDNHSIDLLVAQLENPNVPRAPGLIGTGLWTARDDPPFPAGLSCPVP